MVPGPGLHRSRHGILAPGGSMTEVLALNGQIPSLASDLTEHRASHIRHQLLWMPEFKKTFNITPAVEAYVDKEGKKYVCRVTLPGVEPKDLQIHAQANVLTIRGERKLTHSTKEIELMEGEIVYGVFERTLELPEGVNVEKLTAEYVNGVLEITAPVAAAALPRKIEVKTMAPLVKQIAA